MKLSTTVVILSFLISFSSSAMDQFFEYAASKKYTTKKLPTSMEMYQLLSSYFDENSQTKSVEFIAEQTVLMAFPNDSYDIISFNFFESGKSYILMTGTKGQYIDGAEIIRNGEAGFSVQLYPSECQNLEGKIYGAIMRGLINSKKMKNKNNL